MKILIEKIDLSNDIMSFDLIKYIVRLAAEFDCKITYYVAYQINEYLCNVIDYTIKMLSIYYQYNCTNLKTVIRNLLRLELSAYSELAIYDFYKNNYKHIIPPKLFITINKVTDDIATYLSLVIEFLCIEILDIGRKQSAYRKNNKHPNIIKTINIFNGINNDAEFKLLSTKLNISFQKHSSSLLVNVTKL